MYIVQNLRKNEMFFIPSISWRINTAFPVDSCDRKVETSSGVWTAEISIAYTSVSHKLSVFSNSCSLSAPYSNNLTAVNSFSVGLLAGESVL